MSETWKLTRSYLLQHPARLVLTCIAMAAAACMVIWVVSGYDSLMKQFEDFSDEAPGRYALTVYPVPQSTPGRMPGEEDAVPQDIVQALAADPAVAAADAMWAQRAMVRKYDPKTFNRPAPQRAPGTPGTPGAPGAGRPAPSGDATNARPTAQQGQRPAARPTRRPMRSPFSRGGVTLIGSDAGEPPYEMVAGHWIDASRPDALEAALSKDAAERLEVGLGDEVAAGVGEHATKLKVVGIIDVPQMPKTGRFGPRARGPASGGLYVPMKLAEKMLDRPAHASFVSLALKPGADVHKFRFAWQPRFNEVDRPLQFQDRQELEDELDSSRTARQMLMQAYSATGISLLAALFIIFTTLSMGVSERARQFAMLRAIALTRGQIAWLIAIESAILAVIGWIVGIAAGWVLLAVIAQIQPEMMGGGAVLGPWSLGLSAAVAVGGSLCAAVIPIIRATRLKPLDAMSPRAATRKIHWPRWSVAIGLVLIVLNPLLTFIVPMADESRYAIYMALGCSSMAIGFILLAPGAVVLAERLFGPILAALLRLDPALLRSQLSSNLWRTVGTAVAMTIGLGLFVAMQVWGYTMLRPFEPGRWVPDAMIGFLPDGLPTSQNDAVAHLPGVDPSRCLPLAVEQPKLTGDITHSAERASVTRQDNIVLIGMDPQRGLCGNDPLLKLKWVEGSPASALPLLKSAHGCIVPDHFCRETGLKLGDKFKVNAVDDNDVTFEYVIAGVVNLPGWHWMSKFSGIRLNSGRSAAMVFADYDTVAKDFDLDTVKFYWVDTKPLDAAQARAIAVQGTPPAPAPMMSAAPADTTVREVSNTRWIPTDKEVITAAAQGLAKDVTGEAFKAAGRGFPQMDQGSTVRVTTPVDISDRIRRRADGWIWQMSQLPLITLIVSAIGVLNAILASVRARTWDMGVLRSLGFTRFTLVRLIMAESLLVGVVACLLSLGFGVMAGWCGSGISQYVSFFGGLRPELVIPWGKLWIGLGGALALCFLAAIWPAWMIGRAETLRLLQAGRTSF